MNTILMLAACEIIGERASEAYKMSGDELRAEVLSRLGTCQKWLSAVPEQQKPSWDARVSECKFWLVEYDREQERERMRESLKRRLDALPVMVLTDEERAEIDAAEEAAKAGGFVSNGEVLAGLLERACAEHDRVKALVDKWTSAADRAEQMGASYVRRALLDCSLDLSQALTEPTDQPIADPAERAKAVAKELRRRGLKWIEMMPGDDSITDRNGRVISMKNWNMPTRVISDEIQRQEVQRAKKWADDQ